MNQNWIIIKISDANFLLTMPLHWRRYTRFWFSSNTFCQNRPKGDGFLNFRDDFITYPEGIVPSFEDSLPLLTFQSEHWIRPNYGLSRCGVYLICFV